MCSSSSRGNREISCPSGGARAGRIAPGRRGAVAGDERAREVRPRQSSNEADERSRATGRGGGAKGGGRGERGPAKHTPDAEPGGCDPGAGARTRSSKAKDGVTWEDYEAEL